MTYDRQHISVDFLFTIEGTDEVAVTGLNYSVGAGWAGASGSLDELSVATTQQENIYLAMETFLAQASGMSWADYSRFVAVKFSAVGVSGTYVTGSAPLIYEPSEPAQGIAAAVLPQSTVVLSLRSGSASGVANYGRMYIPHTRFQLTAGSPYADPSLPPLIAGKGADFIDAVTTNLVAGTSAPLRVKIMTNKTGSPAKDVQSVAVGSVVDTQRRRRNRLNEVYSFDALTV